MADTWLEPGTVQAVLPPGVAEQVDAESLAAIVPGVRDWVEQQRKDLFAEVGDPPAEEFQATPSVVLGAALLAWRTYNRPGTPLGVVGASEDGYAGIIREDPDIARYLGVGSAGKFVFGAATVAVEEVV